MIGLHWFDLFRWWRVELDHSPYCSELYSVDVKVSVQEGSSFIPSFHGSVRKDGCFNFMTDDVDVFHGCDLEDTLIVRKAYIFAMEYIEEYNERKRVD